MLKPSYFFVAVLAILLPYLGLQSLKKSSLDDSLVQSQSINPKDLAGATVQETDITSSVPDELTKAQKDNYIDMGFGDFTQTHIQGVGTGNGQQYCAPVAASNSLLWLAKRHLYIDNSLPLEQEALILQLASDEFMDTSLKNGTGVRGFLAGIDKAATLMFGGYQSLDYEGWRPHPEAFSAQASQPSIYRLSHAISDTSAAWLNIGWYRYDSTTKEYRRYGGHWVTLVGSEVSNGATKLVIHDPAPRAGQTPQSQYISYSLIDDGLLTGDKKGLPHPAQGYIRIDEGLAKKNPTDTAIIDGVVYLQI